MATVKLTGRPQRKAIRSAPVGQDEERPVGDHRRLADGGSGLLPAEMAAVIGRDRPDPAVRARDHQPVADEHGARPEDRLLPILRILEARQRMHPDDDAALAGDAEELAVDGHHEQEVAGDPRCVETGDVPLPDAPAGSQIDGDQPSAMADRESHAPVDDRAAVDVVEGRERADAGALDGEDVGPDRAAVLDPERGQLAGREGCEDDAAVHRRARAAEEAGALHDPGMAPLNDPAARIQRPEAVVMADGEDAAAGDHGRCAHRHADHLAPRDLPGLRLQRKHVAEARGHIQALPRHRETAAESAFLILLRRHADGPQPGAAGRVEGRDQALRIHGEDPPAGDHRRREDGAVIVDTVADPDAPALGEDIGRGEVVHGVVGSADCLRPVFVHVGRRQAHREPGCGGVRLQRPVERDHREPLAGQPFLLRPVEPFGQRCRSPRGRARGRDKAGPRPARSMRDRRCSFRRVLA